MRAELQDALARLRRERGDEDERADLRIAERGVGDHRAAVGVPDEDDRPGDLVEDVADRGGIAREAAQRVVGHDDGIAVGAQAPGHITPARGAVPRPVHDDDRRLGRPDLLGLRLRGGRQPGDAECDEHEEDRPPHSDDRARSRAPQGISWRERRRRPSVDVQPRRRCARDLASSRRVPAPGERDGHPAVRPGVGLREHAHVDARVENHHRLGHGRQPTARRRAPPRGTRPRRPATAEAPPHRAPAGRGSRARAARTPTGSA